MKIITFIEFAELLCLRKLINRVVAVEKPTIFAVIEEAVLFQQFRQTSATQR